MHEIRHTPQVRQTHVEGRTEYRRLVDGNVLCAGSAAYQICFRFPRDGDGFIKGL